MTPIYTVKSWYLEGPVLEGGENFSIDGLTTLITENIAEFNVDPESFIPHKTKIGNLKVGKSYSFTHTEEFLADPAESDDMEDETFKIMVKRIK